MVWEYISVEKVATLLDGVDFSGRVVRVWGFDGGNAITTLALSLK